MKKDDYPIIEKKDGDFIIKISSTEDGEPNPDTVKNIKDIINSYLEEKKIRDILRIIYDLSPAYFNEILGVYGKMPKTTLTRFLEKLTNQNIIDLADICEDDIQNKIKNQKIPKGVSPSKFYRVNLQRTIFDRKANATVTIKDFIRQDKISKRVLEKIKRRTEFNEKITKENIITNLPDHIRVKKYLEKELRIKQAYHRDKLQTLCYHALGRWIQKKSFNLTEEYLKEEGFIIREGFNFYLINPFLVPKETSEEPKDKHLVSKIE